MEMILNFLLLFDGMMALYSHDENLGTTSEYGAHRPKRLVYGQQVFKEDQDYYPSTAYQSTLISAHYCNENLLNILQQLHLLKPGHWDLIENWKIQAKHVKDLIVAHCPIDKTRAYCGGAAITEYAVQTACHCIARFDSRSTVELAIPKVYNAWEDMIFLYVGARSFDKDNTPYVSKDFITHQNCKLIANASISHNLGIVVLRYRLQQGTKIATPTIMAEMRAMWHYVIGKQVVCLVVGWGSVDFEGKDVYGLPSFDLRKTWRVMRSFVYCYLTHKSISEFVFTLRLNSKTNYKDIQTWSCSTDFGKLQSGIGHGDSGSPVACLQGWYFGVSNWGLTAYDKKDRPFSITTDTDLVYALFENSWDYRPDFNKYIHDVQDRTIYPSEYPTFKPRFHHKFAKTGKPGSDIASQSDRLRGDLSPFFLTSVHMLRYIHRELRKPH